MPETVDIPTYHGPIAAGGRAVGASRLCQRPGCAVDAAATLTFAYASRESWIGPLATELTPQAYDLCGPHADRTEPPSGWALRDRRGATRASSDAASLRVPPVPSEPSEAPVSAPVGGPARVAPPRRDVPRRSHPSPHPTPSPVPTARAGAAARSDPPIEVRARAW